MDSFSGQPSPSAKKHKKHKKDRDRGDKSDKYEGYGAPLSGTAGIKLILKVGGSSTPEHSDSPGPSGPMSLSVMNAPYDAEDSQHSSISLSHLKKAKKKDKKKKKEKKHKHHHKEKKQRKEKEEFETSSVSMSMDVDSVESGTLRIKNELASPLPMDVEDANSSSSIGVILKESRPPVVSKPKTTEKHNPYKFLDYLLKMLEKKDPQQFFAWPVTDKIAPGYSSIIKKPMDFSTMRKKLVNDAYLSLNEFAEDFQLMCNNAMTYNQSETIYYKAAKKLLQGGLKILSPEKIRALLPIVPSIRLLSEDFMGFPLFPDSIQQDAGEASHSEDENLESICLDPMKSIHYMPPHPNDPADLCGAFTDDLATEEVLLQARLAAREAAHRLSTKRPNSKMGFLRQRQDGSTSLAILTPSNGVLPGTREQPMSIGALSGKIEGTTRLNVPKEDKKNLQRPVKPLYYGAFSSYAPNQDSTFSNLTPQESDMLSSTYGDETSIQYAESMIEFAKGCDYAMHMVDEILDTITKGEHRKTVNFVQERKKIEEEEARMRKQQEELTAQLEMEWQNVHQVPVPIVNSGLPNINFDTLHSLHDLGIDTQFLDEFKGHENNSASAKLQETAGLIGDLERVQRERLSKPTFDVPPYAPPPTEQETQLVTRITDNLTDMAKQITPGEIVSAEAIRGALGIDINSATYMSPAMNKQAVSNFTYNEPSSNTHAGGNQQKVPSSNEQAVSSPKPTPSSTAESNTTA